MKSLNVSDDALAADIERFVIKAEGPVGTKEVEAAFPDAKRSKVLYRLQELRAQGRIKGRMMPGGRGSWVFWA